jgi:hypothetical protein
VASNDLNQAEAFGRFGAKAGARSKSMSAMAADGALVLACQHDFFCHPAAGVLRYEDELSRLEKSADTKLLSQHLILARDSELPIRMVIVRASRRSERATRSFQVRPDLVGALVKFDGNQFVVDFTRVQLSGKELGARLK